MNLAQEEPGLCRCCHSEGCCKDLTEEYIWMGETEVYGDMLEETFNIEVTEFQSRESINGSKKLICKYCIMRLREAYTFRKQVLANERKLAELLGHVKPEDSGDPEVTVKMEPAESTLKAEPEDIDIVEHGVENRILTTGPVAEPCAKPDPLLIDVHEPASKRRRHSDAVTAHSVSAQATRSESCGGHKVHKPTVMHGENAPRSRGCGMHHENINESPRLSDVSSTTMLVFLQNGEQRLIKFILPIESITLQRVLEQLNIPFSSDTHVQVLHNINGGDQVDYFVAVGLNSRIEDLIKNHPLFLGNSMGLQPLISEKLQLPNMSQLNSMASGEKAAAESPGKRKRFILQKAGAATGLGGGGRVFSEKNGGGACSCSRGRILYTL